MELKEIVVEYMEGHNICTLATSKGNIPHASTVEYASDGLTLYFFTSPTSCKIANIKANPKIALTIDEDYPDWMKIKGIQLLGEAEILKGREIEKAKEVFIKKFPFVAQFVGELEGVWVKITPTKIYFLDNEKGLGHRELLEV